MNQFWIKKYSSQIGVAAAFVLLCCISGDFIAFNPIQAATEFPGGFIWFLEQFAPNSAAFEQLPRILQALSKTVLDAIAAGLLGAICAYGLASLGSRVTSPCRGIWVTLLQIPIRALATLLRNIPTVAWGFVLLFSFKQSEFTGFLALYFKSLGFLTRAFLETIDEVDSGPIEALKAVGATRLQIIGRAVFPSTLPTNLSWLLYMIETNFRDATLVGMLTGSGIGFVFNWYYRQFRYPIAGLVIIAIAVAVLLIETCSNYIRRRIDSPTSSLATGPIRYGQLIAAAPLNFTRLLSFGLFAVLAALTVFTFWQMDYGKADLLRASTDLFKYFAIMLASPHLVNYTVEETAIAMGVTLSIAVLATAGGFILAFVLGLVGAKNLCGAAASNAVKAIMALVRSVPTIIWILVFTVAIGLGPEAAIVGMMFHTVSFLTKAFSEAFEGVDGGVLEALRSCGAPWPAIIGRGVLAEKMSEVLSWTFIRFENNFVGAVTAGAIAGSGGIGYQLYIVANYRFDWHEVGMIIYLCLAVSVALEVVATKLRKRFML